MLMAVIAVVAGCAAGAAALPLDFWRENIAVDIAAPDTITVTGEYFFRTPTGAPANVQLFYPFPIDSIHQMPVRWQVRPMAGGELLACQTGRDGILFPVRVDSASVCSLRITYTQPVRAQRARYILTTTSAWGKPLGPSNYSVTLSSRFTLTSLSYPADTVVSRKGRTTHRFLKDNFMPDRDLEFEWRAADPRRQSR